MTVIQLLAAQPGYSSMDNCFLRRYPLSTHIIYLHIYPYIYW